jgi:hypothetical protein
MRRIAIVLALATLAAAPATRPSAPALRPGLWQVESTPQVATLDGRRLAELPYTAPPPQAICLTAAEAADPATWFARDSAGCTLTRRAVSGGNVAIEGSCPSPDAGRARGSVRLTGRYNADSYAVRFATIVNGDNGRMGFDGMMTGKRIGDCPAAR